MDGYLESGIAPSTARTYRAGIKHYLSLCEQLHTQSTPTTEPLLCRFVTYLANLNVSHNSIKVYLAGIRQLHVRRGDRMPLSDDMPRLNQVLRGIKMCQSRCNATAPQPRLPITPEALLRIKIYWEHLGIDADKTMLWAAFTIAFFGFMRSGELCVGTDGPFDPDKDLTARDVQVDNLHNPQLLKIHLKQSKTDPFRVGTDIFMSRTHDQLCPVSALLAWLICSGNNQTGPLFYFQSGAPLTRSSFVIKLKEALAAVGIDPTRFAGHSFRSGAATAAAKVGLSDSTIKQLGRWRSTAYQRYIRPSPATLGALASSISATDQGPLPEQ